MTAEQIIPPIADPQTKANWYQPHRRFIEMDDESALMTEQTFRGLIDRPYYHFPAAFSGKMWKAKYGDKWFLLWYSNCDNPNCVNIHTREILIL